MVSHRRAKRSPRYRPVCGKPAVCAWVPRARRCRRCKKYEDKLVARALQRDEERYYEDVAAEEQVWARR